MLAMAFKTILPGTYDPFKYVTTKLRLASQPLVGLLLLNNLGIARRTGTISWMLKERKQWNEW